MITFFRRRGLGLTSCNEMARYINEMGGRARVVRNDRLPVLPDDDMVVRWGCTSPLGNSRVTVINSARAIHKCNDKAGLRMELQEQGYPVPRTWRTVRQWEADSYDGPVIVRPHTHSRGRHLLHTCDPYAVREFFTYYGDAYISEYIEKEREVRVFVANGRAVWVTEKTPGNPEDVAWNVAQGGRFDNIRWGDWPVAAVEAAIGCANVAGADFAGVDVMLDSDGRPYILEANSAPSQTSPYRQQCCAKVFLWMERNGKDRFGTPDGTSWKDFIHPAIKGGTLWTS